MFVGNTGPSETSSRFEKLTDPLSATYNLTQNNIKVSWTSPGTPSAIDKDYLTNYFKNNWKVQPEKYLNKRLSYNSSNIGDFGFDVYLTNGSSSKYVGWTPNTEYTIDLTKYTETYDGVIIKSAYSKFKSNASDGYKIAVAINKPEPIDEAELSVNMDGLTQTLPLNSTFTELTTTSITSITYKGTEIKSEVSNLSMVTSGVTKEGSTDKITPSDITKSAGTYKVSYSVSFNYKKNPVTKVYIQTITVE